MFSSIHFTPLSLGNRSLGNWDRADPSSVMPLSPLQTRLAYFDPVSHCSSSKKKCAAPKNRHWDTRLPLSHISIQFSYLHWKNKSWTNHTLSARIYITVAHVKTKRHCCVCLVVRGIWTIMMFMSWVVSRTILLAGLPTADKDGGAVRWVKIRSQSWCWETQQAEDEKGC